MEAETLHNVVSYLLDKPHVYAVVPVVLFALYLLFLAGKVMRSEE
jgi:hypothetical protein